MHKSPFYLPADQYKRKITPVNTYLRDTSSYLHIMTGRDQLECLEFVRSTLRPGGLFEFKDTPIKYAYRDDNGDRKLHDGTLLRYISEAVAAKEIIAPTLTTYVSPDVKESYLVPFIDDNVKQRGVAKKIMFKARMDKDFVRAAIYHNKQNNKKTSNNSISGAHCSPGTPLHNPTAHSSLTSNCRSTSGNGNANNEKFLAGNRHYHSPMVTRNNIISIINCTDLELVQKVMDRYCLNYPTVEQTMACITRSTKHYWWERHEMDRIHQLVSRLTPVQRAAVVYVGDFYHLREFNEDFVRELLNDFSRLKDDDSVPLEACKEILESQSEDNCNLAIMIVDKPMRGQKIKEIVGTPTYRKVALTAKNITDTSDKYADLIKAFWVTDNVPASLGYFPESIRHVALTSDTDSTIFTVQDWQIWYSGKPSFDQPANAVAATMVWFTAQTIIHILARMSANFGIQTKRMFQIAMKNEFKFDVFIPTQVAKHYFALIGCQEGNLYEDYIKEIKGVHLKSSNAPIAIIKAATKMMEDIMYTVLRGESISIEKILKEVASHERAVLDSIRKGESTYFRRVQIKEPGAYSKGPTESNYQHYTLWEAVFAPKYGSMPPPTVGCIKVSVNLKSPVAIGQWLENMKDKELAERMKAYIIKYKKTNFTTFFIPTSCIDIHGIPEELLDVCGARDMAADICRIFYIIVETLGFYSTTSKNLRLISDFY